MIDIHLKKILELVNETGEAIEGNCYTFHLRNEMAPKLKSKQENLSLFAKQCSYILEIGFNAGHSSLFFLESNPNVKVISIDIGFHSYSRPCYDYLKSIYENRIEVLFMNSMNISSNEYLKEYQFDGLHIDGSNENDMYIYDLINSLHLLKDGALVIFDDIQKREIQNFKERCKSSILFKVPDIPFQETMMYSHEILQYIKPKIKIVSLASGDKYRETWKYGLESKYRYCEKWKYPFIDESKNLDPSRPIPWSKIKLIEREMNDCDIIVWIDADTWIMNDRHKIEEFLLCMSKNKWMMIGEDLNEVINSGVFFMRNCEESKLFLKEVYEQTQFINHCWWENKAIIHLYPKYKKSIQKIPREFIRLFNGYDKNVDKKHHYRDGDFIIHLPGGKKALPKYNSLYLANSTFSEYITWNHLVKYLTI